MTINRTPLAVGLAATLLLGACAPVTSYTDAVAPRNLTTDSATTRVDLHFAPGSAQLSSADAAKLRHLAAAGSIGAADRVTVASSGSHLGHVISNLLYHHIEGRLCGSNPLSRALFELGEVRARRGIADLFG
ncbi:MAG TPA: hypothetical protein VGR70_00195 [Stellaceae bacterium]|nr:hypothetical protein [Stellaceae bacterium]